MVYRQRDRHLIVVWRCSNMDPPHVINLTPSSQTSVQHEAAQSFSSSIQPILYHLLVPVPSLFPVRHRFHLHPPPLGTYTHQFTNLHHFHHSSTTTTTSATTVVTMGKSQSKLTPEQLSDLQKHTYCQSPSSSSVQPVLIFSQSTSESFNNG